MIKAMITTDKHTRVPSVAVAVSVAVPIVVPFSFPITVSLRLKSIEVPVLFPVRVNFDLHVNIHDGVKNCASEPRLKSESLVRAGSKQLAMAHGHLADGGHSDTHDDFLRLPTEYEQP
jgi:hypothetical protein